VSYSVPFPLIVADSASPSANASNILPGDAVPLSNPIYEFSLCESGPALIVMRCGRQTFSL
jgi:lysophospholipase